MATHAVLTGDIVRSREISPRERLIDTLKEALDTAAATLQAEYDVYRGDSFQLVMPDPAAAAQAAVIIRARLKSHAPATNKACDARISIGIGDITYQAGKVTESDGPAFLLSGEGLDELNRDKRRLIIRTPWEQAGRTLDLVTRFADDIISNWSHYSAETAFFSLVHEETQMELAARLGKSQSTIHDRMATAKLDLVRAYIQHVANYVRWETGT